MKITDLETRHYRIDLQPPFRAAWDPVPRDRFDETIVIVQSDQGICGYAGGAAVPDLELLERLLVGIDPADHERIFGICETVDFHGGRPWTVEVATFDLAARVAGQPLWEYLGGTRDRFTAYASCGETVSLGERVERTLAWKEAGIRAAKLRFHDQDWRSDLAVLDSVSEAVSDSMELLVDANQGWRMPGDLTPRWTVDKALECARALDERAVYWLEEPLGTHDVDGYRQLKESTTKLRIAAGEMARGLPDSYRLITAGAVDIIQNDVVLAGGVTGCLRVADLAKQHGLVWSPHTWSTGFGLLANLHVALAASPAEFIEVPFDPPGWSPDRRDFMLAGPIEIVDGCIAPPPGAGLGPEPDLAFLERFRVG